MVHIFLGLLNYHRQVCAIVIICILLILTSGCSQPHTGTVLPPSLPDNSSSLQQTVVPLPGTDRPIPGPAASATGCFLSAGSGNSSCLFLTFIDVAQGDAILVRSPSGRTMLIDAGKPDHRNDVLSVLQNLGVSSIDILIATHSHGDHIGGMPAVIQTFPVRQFVQSAVPCGSSECRTLHAALSQKEVPVQVVGKGNSIAFDPAINVTVLNPPENLYGDVNDNSLVLRLAYGNTTFILTGDAGKDAEAGMISAGLPIRADVLKAGHHGLSSSTTGPFVSRIDPEITVISLEMSTRPTHPDPNVIRRLEESGSVIYRTDKDGTISIASDGSTLAVVTGKNRTPVWYPVPAAAVSA
nr:MBL fold metallo-hydrolase [uncultured Methanoregula sp.]